MSGTKRRVFLWGCAVLLLAALVCIFPLPSRVSRTVTAVEFSLLDPSLENIYEVQIDGWYYRYLLRDDVFKGEIRTPALPESGADGKDTVAEMWALSFARDAFFQNAVLGYWLYTGQAGGAPTISSLFLGDVYVHGNFRDALIAFYAEQEGHVYSGRFLALDAATRDAGLVSLERYAKASGFLKVSLEQDGLWDGPNGA